MVRICQQGAPSLILHQVAPLRRKQGFLPTPHPTLTLPLTTGRWCLRSSLQRPTGGLCRLWQSPHSVWQQPPGISRLWRHLVRDQNNDRSVGHCMHSRWHKGLLHLHRHHEMVHHHSNVRVGAFVDRHDHPDEQNTFKGVRQCRWVGGGRACRVLVKNVCFHICNAGRMAGRLARLGALAGCQVV